MFLAIHHVHGARGRKLWSQVIQRLGAEQTNNSKQFALPEQAGAFKSPSLRGVAQRLPYMHDGQYVALLDVFIHYNNSPVAIFGTSELPGPRNLAAQQLDGLKA